jgi:GAF domain-containing protein
MEPPDVPESGPPPSPALLHSLAANPAAMADLIGALHRRVHDALGLVDLMGRAAREAVRLLPGIGWAGVTAQLDGPPFTAASTDPLVLAVDESQYLVDDGPCLRAMRSGAPVSMTLSQVTAAWPELGAAAAQVGVRSFLAVPLRAHSKPLGALNLYSADPVIEGIDADVLTVLTEYLDRGLTEYLDLQLPPVTDLALRTAVSGWVVVEQAVGVLMQEHGFSADYARQVLSDQAEDWSRTLPEQAAAVIARASGQGYPPG